MPIAWLLPVRRHAAGWRLASVLAATTVAAGCASSLSMSPRSGATDQTRAIHLLNRATYGARPQDVQEVFRLGIDGWLARQLQPTHPPIVAEAPAVPVPEAAPAMNAVVRLGDQQVMLVRLADAQNITNLVFWKLERAVKSERQLEEVMTDFWFNHFNVDYNKNFNVRYALADYEQNAIRQHVFGRFEDMLRATAQHPAMLIYLDNALSTAAPPPGAPNRAQRAGLNENYARELLELHTLGVAGGYTQQDVIEVARAFTGWGTVNRSTQTQVSGRTVQRITGVDFQFHADRHDRGAKTVLGRTLPAGRGMEDGSDVLGMLASHPATAQHIATKLARHFVADEPPPALVAELATVFQRTNGDLRDVTRALFTAQAFYDPAHYRTKVKRPFEFIASALRVSGARVQSTAALVTQLRAFGHLPYAEPAPTGYPTTADAWLSAGAMMGRMRFAIDMPAGRVNGMAIDRAQTVLGDDGDTLLAGRARPGSPLERQEALRALTARVLERTLPGAASDRLQAAILDDLAQHSTADASAVIRRALGLALGSPEFQRH